MILRQEIFSQSSFIPHIYSYTPMGWENDFLNFAAAFGAESGLSSHFSSADYSIYFDVPVEI